MKGRSVLRERFSWASRNFWLFWGGQTVSLFGDHLYLFAVLWWILIETGSALAMSGALLISTATALGWAPAAGALADRIDRRKLLILVNLLYVITVGVTGAIFLLGHMTLVIVYAATVMVTSLDQFYASAVGAAVPNLVREESLVRANGMIETSKAVTGIAAPIMGGALLAVYSVGLLVVANALTFLLNAAALARVDVPLRATLSEPGPRRSLLIDSWEGIRFLRSRADLLVLIVLISLVNMAIAPSAVLIPSAVLEDFRLGPTAIGIAMGAFALGVLVASQVMVWFRSPRSETLMLILAIVGLGAGNLLFGLSSVYVLALSGSFVAGASIIVSIVAAQTLFQRLTPDDLRGRVMSFRRALLLLLRPAGLLGGAALADVTRPQIAIVATAVVLLVVAGAGFQSPPIRRLARLELASVRGADLTRA